MRIDWTQDEVEVVVAGYFAMWAEIRAGNKVNKQERYRAMASVIGRRPPGAVERKCQNISAVLRDFGFDLWCPGLQPNSNYQKLLAKAVLEWVDGTPEWLNLIRASDEGVGVTIHPLALPIDIHHLEVAPPSGRDPLIRAVAALAPERSSRILDYVARDQRNRQLGEQGEAFVLEVEQRRLHDVERRPDLAKRVEWTAKTKGDGWGYDITSFNADGSPRLIEVKTTTMGMRAPFFVTANELKVSTREAQAYQLCRVFEFSRTSQFYRVNGALDSSCWLEPQTYMAGVR
jgi:hypothetical protein